MPIQILSEDLVNKIAAGEVVERPASVVKELVENAIDAEATQIKIEIQQAGSKLIRVSDNGKGMTEEEIKLAVQRHATSKITSLDDLFNIQSLGFRGEALPSIASVSRFLLERNPSGKGVTATVKDLFHNTPARKKFMKSPGTEMGHLGDVISKYAMAYPAIAFELVSDGKPMLTSPGTGQLKDAVMAVYGLDLVKGLIEVDSDNVKGLVSLPTLSRIDRSYITFYVNGRYVKDFLLNRALQEAYRTLIPGNRFPVGIIFVSVNPKQVDVNVHPTKKEVKFVKTNEVMARVTEAVRNSLANVTDIRSVVNGVDVSAEVRGGTWGQEFSAPHQTSHFQTHILTPTPLHFPQDLEIQIDSVQPLFPIYQHKSTYIVATDGEDLVLIDQHAAQERIIYDRLSTKRTENCEQLLLTPETVELGPKEFAALKDQLGYLKEIGFDVEEFGGKSLLVRSLPAGVETSAKNLLTDLASDLQGAGKTIQLEVKQETIRKSIACKAAIKSGDKLSQQEMNELIKNLFATENPLTCPHGRPVMFRITEEEIKKRVARQ
ncbi:MAG: DNA mismatch repair endonuclease MutL [bacterium]